MKIGQVSNGLPTVHIHTTLSMKTFHMTHVKVIQEVDKALKAVEAKRVQNVEGITKKCIFW